jgi:hypothetical protein
MTTDPEALLRASPASSGRRLESWKEIADYLRRGVTTVQRWEREEGLPVHRHVHNAGGSVFAFTEDLDRWRATREPAPAAAPGVVSRTATDAPGWATPGGAMPPGSPFYISRAADDEFRDAVARRAAIVLVKGARQAGKSSLLARTLSDARERRALVAFTDIQALGHDDLRSPTAFYQALARSVAEQIRIPASILSSWNDHDSPNTNFSRYVQRAVLGGPHHVVWGLDEVDRLVGLDFAVDVFGLFRSWHNRRALDPAAPWGRLTLVMAYATEAHLLIADVNQSPFNVGVRVTLEDFEAADAMELNGRYGSVLGTAEDVNRLMALAGGHPYLLQCAFAELKRGVALDQLEADARREKGPLGDHLRRLRAMLERDPALEQAMRAIVGEGACPDRERFYRLRSAGLIQGSSPADARPRCGLYRQLAQA